MGERKGGEDRRPPDAPKKADCENLDVRRDGSLRRYIYSVNHKTGRSVVSRGTKRRAQESDAQHVGRKRADLGTRTTARDQETRGDILCWWNAAEGREKTGTCASGVHQWLLWFGRGLDKDQTRKQSVTVQRRGMGVARVLGSPTANEAEDHGGSNGEWP